MDTNALQLMFQNGMPSVGAMGLGQGMAADREMQAQKLRAATMENDQAAVMNPLNAQFKQGQITQQGAELPGIQGQSASFAAKGTEDTSVLATKIASHMSALSTSIGNDGMVQMGQDGEKLAHAAQIIKQYPPALQKQAFAKAVQQYGGDVNSPTFKGVLQVPDEQFQQAAEAMGKGMALAGQKYTQESTAASSAQASHEKIASGNNTTSENVARIAAASRVEAANARSKAAMNHMNMDQKITYLSGIPEGDRTEAESVQLNSLAKQRLTEKAAAAPAVAPTVLEQKTNQQTARDTADQNFPTRPHEVLQDESQVATLLQKQGMSYEPTKYMYRVVNGVAQRKPK